MKLTVMGLLFTSWIWKNCDFPRVLEFQKTVDVDGFLMMSASFCRMQ